LTPLAQAARNPSVLLNRAPSPGQFNPESILNTVRNVDRVQLATAGVVVAEVLGFFTVGEMLGRLKLVGYRGEVHHEH
jgi:F-type H+-transporting ATPase subunit g